MAWQDRVHFFAVSARLLRRILVDHAKAGKRQKRGGGAENIVLDEAVMIRSADHFGDHRTRSGAPAPGRSGPTEERHDRTIMLRRAHL